MPAVVIIGGGIAGTAAALALGKASVDAGVYESHPVSSHDRGAFLTLASNGMHALRQIKADTAVSAVSAPLRTMRICNGAGHEIVTVPLGDAHDPAIGYRYLTRAALCSALHAKRRNRESVSNGETPHPRHHHRTAIFSDGSRASGDVLAAAIVRAAHQILVTNAYDLPEVSRWHRDRMLIIGDAAHAASPRPARALHWPSKMR